MSVNNKKLKVLELFAGVGGFRLGLEGYKGKSATSGYTKSLLNDVGFEVVYSNQWEPSTKTQHASDVYSERFGSDGHYNVDLSTLSVDELKQDIDLLVGGFPCQDYSVANSLRTSKGLIGKKGVLWWQIERILSELGDRKPKYLVLENVDRLLKSPVNKRGRDFSVMLSSLNDLGYVVEWRIINAAEYGFPQRRRRVFIVGYLKDSKPFQSLQKFEKLDWIEKNSVLGSVFPCSYKGMENHFTLEGTLEQISNDYGSTSGKSIYHNSGISIDREVFTFDVMSQLEKVKLPLGKILVKEDEVEEEFWIDDESLERWKVEKGAKKKERVSSTGHTYIFSEGGMNFPEPLDSPSRTIITSEGGKSPSRFKHVVEQGGKLRRLTPVELEKLNMFPEDFTKSNVVNNTKRAFLMGNALVVGIIERIGNSISNFESGV
jgi:DNA (cytosine-5)-methyltransferase 1